MTQRWRGRHVFDTIAARPNNRLAQAYNLLDMDVIQYREDFMHFDAAEWTVVQDAGKTGTDGAVDRIGGWIKVFCDGDDNDECYYIHDGENFKFAASKPMYFETRILLTEANTDDANWIIGLSNAAGANMLLDNGGGPAASYDGAVFFKVDGTMSIGFEVSNAGTQATQAAAVDFTSATQYRLAFLFDPGAGTTGTITPYINDTAYTAQSITLAGLEEMHLFFGVKAGGANEEAIEVDYFQVLQTR